MVQKILLSSGFSITCSYGPMEQTSVSFGTVFSGLRAHAQACDFGEMGRLKNGLPPLSLSLEMELMR